MPRWRCHPPSPLHPPLQRKLQDQRQCIVAEFEQGHRFLREQEQHLLDQLARLERELTEGREKYKTRGVEELAQLALVISELEGKAQQPAAELMQVRPSAGPGARIPGQWVQALPLTCMTLGVSLPPGASVFSSETWGDDPALPHFFQWLHEHKMR